MQYFIKTLTLLSRENFQKSQYYFLLKKFYEIPSTTDILFDRNVELLPSVTEIFEYQLAYLKRLTTIIRIVDIPELSKLVYKEKWFRIGDPKSINEWSDNTILRLIKENKFFRKGLINLFFEGATIPFLADTIPLFELKKLSISKLKFETSEMIDSLIRYKEKGSYSG